MKADNVLISHVGRYSLIPALQTPRLQKLKMLRKIIKGNLMLLGQWDLVPHLIEMSHVTYCTQLGVWSLISLAVFNIAGELSCFPHVKMRKSSCVYLMLYIFGY